MKTTRILSSLTMSFILPLLHLESSAAVTVSTDRTLAAGDLSLEGQEMIVSGATLTVAGTHSFRSLQLVNKAVLTHAAAPAGQAENVVRLTVAGDVIVDGSARVDVTGGGYAQAGTPGAGGRGGSAGGGGGHGGHGRRSAGNPPGAGGAAHGAITSPDSWGGAGGNGVGSAFSAGGGVIHIEAGGVIEMAGLIRADGEVGAVNDQGGGAGGTIYLKAATLRGGGAISANGGAGEWVDGGGGAGGRIALFFTNNEFTGTLSAFGGGGAGQGGAGTIYLKASGAALGDLHLENSQADEETPLTTPVPYNVSVRAGAIAVPVEPLNLGSLVVANGGTLRQATTSSNLVLNATGDVTVELEGIVTGDGSGYPFHGERGPGAGVRRDWAGTGGGHGGWGGVSATGGAGGDSYDSLLEPIMMGSAGGDSSSGAGTAGGGAIRLIVGGKLTVQGRVSADGAGSPPNDAGGGAGGSVWVTAGTLSGAGIVRADGGPGEWQEGGGGAGGRIALYYASSDFTGTTRALGAPSRPGGAGTVYLRRASESRGQLIVDNGGVWGNYTPLQSPEAFRLLLSGRASAFAESALTVAQLDLGSESILTHLTGQTNLQVHVTGDAIIASGAQLVADGRGYPVGSNRGPGTGLRRDWGGSGAGHGGTGGDSRTAGAGGPGYDSILAPVMLGSQGGDADGGVGTAGGGAIRLIVDGKLTLDGRLSVDGAGAPPNNAGGGSGGSVYLTVNTLAGKGAISANGGVGEWVDGGGGGGGGGGRIAIYYGANEFSGLVTAYGAGGFQRGGAGTIYSRKNGTTYGQVLINNGGTWGAHTPLTSPEPFEVTLAEMAVAYPDGALTVRNFEVQTNSILTHLPSQARCEVNALDTLTVADGGAIHADGRGFQPTDNLGPGGGVQLSWGGGGGAHGGVGGHAGSGALGGMNYGSITDPIEAGSAGGPGDGGPGGAGGGVLRLIAGNRLAIEGRVTANGLNGILNNSGGGAGGSILIMAKTMSGRGSILADGGAGEWVDGGGGGGGRIALHVSENGFKGPLFARGGGGHERGGAGSIYTRMGNEPGGDLVFNNEGNVGVESPLEVPPGTRLVLSGAAAIYPTKILEVMSLQVKSGASLTHAKGQSALTVQVEKDLVIESAAFLSADGKGYPLGDDPGPGVGVRVSWGGSGAGHGGDGGRGASGGAGGFGYGSILEPVTLGSKGGDGDGGPGGAGGGAIRLRVSGQLIVDGTISANGINGVPNNSGGGAGGSIWINAANLAGKGTITCNGGAGEWVDGGGGAGGRIALYLGAENFEGVVTAQGRGGSQYGGAGTIYTRYTGESVGHVLVENGEQPGAHTPLTAPEPYHLTLARQAQAYPPNPIVLGTLTVETNSTVNHLAAQPGLELVVLGDAIVNGGIDVTGRGYPLGDNLGPGGGTRISWGGSGAGHGGAGGASATKAPGGPAYGSMLEPTTLGSAGGPGDGGPGGGGGGAMRLIIGGTLTINGRIASDGGRGVSNNSGGGAGGSIFISTRGLAGGGLITANGGAGEWVDGGGGGGGHIAIHRAASSFTGTLSADGAGGSARGENGTIYQAAASTVVWLAPEEGWLNGVVPLQIAALATSGTPASARFNVTRGGGESVIATVPMTITASSEWNTTAMADGPAELHVTVLDAAGNALWQASRSVLINNAVIWHRGMITGTETWPAGATHVVDGELLIASGGVLTIEPGAVVKFVTGGKLTLLSGATLNATGSASASVVLTSFLDDSVGSDSNLDGAQSRPLPGAWRLALRAGATFTANDFTRLKFNSQTFGGTLTASTIWTADSLHEVTEVVTVAASATLTLDPGSIVKFSKGAGIDVQAGGKLVALGTFAQPVVLTSVRDDAYGGDTNDDGSATSPAAGDWRSVRFLDGASGEIAYAEIRFGGDSVGNPWGAGGVIEALGGPLTVRNSVIADALKDGAFCYGSTRFENCLVLRCDRGLTAVGEMQIINCTLDGNRIGLLEHVGHLIVRNSIVAHSLEVGIAHDLGGSTPDVTFCNVWNPEARSGNYTGTTDRTGQDGNISAAPRYKNRDADNFRLNYATPGIDAADGTSAPVSDFAGIARFDDPRTGNTGVASDNGASPDIGAFEFADDAPSNIDLVVIGVSGPAQATAGGLAHIEWTVVNRGTEIFSGPWHDAIYLRRTSGGDRILAGEILVGRGETLGPGQSLRAGADVRVPGGVAEAYHWVVAGNSRGDLFEAANAANNESAATTSVALEVQEIPLDGAPVAAQFSAQEEAVWFQCRAPAGKDVRLALNLASDAGTTELYVGRGFVPTPENFTARQREWNQPDTTTVASGAGGPTDPEDENVFYVVAIGRVLKATPENFTVQASAADFTVERVAPVTVGNAGLVTLEIRGSKFAGDTEFAVRTGADQRVAVRKSVRESGRVFATFDLTGLAPGKAEVAAQNGGLTVALTEAVEVTAGGTGDFYATLNGPGTARAGRVTTWFITYGNRGSVDVPLPMLRFRAPGATEISLFESTLNWADSFALLALNPDVLLPTLGPAQEVTVEVRLKTFSSLTAQLDVLTGDALAANTTPFNWNSLTAPAGANAAVWAQLTGGLAARLGAAVSDYAGLLERDLENLRASDLRYSYTANVNGRWLFGDEPAGVSTPNEIIEIPADEPEGVDAAQLHAAPAKIPGDGIRKTWWVVITVQDYANRRSPDGKGAKDLPGTQQDYDDLMTYLQDELRTPLAQIGGGHDAPNDGAAWTRDNILSAIRAMKGKVDADDNLVVVLSGHGGRKVRSDVGYFCANGGNISSAAFSQAINEVGAGTTYLVNDSCHSEAFNERINAENTTFVGFAATKKDRISWDTASGGELVSNLKGQLRKCRGLGFSFELAEQLVAHKYASRTNIVHQQDPVLTNPTGASLEGKPWNDPSGFEQEIARILRNLPYNPWVQAGLGIVGSVDPNDKLRLAGAGAAGWVQTGQALPYEILFENKTNAPAPAQEVLVTDNLDPKYDWSTFELKAIAFNDARITVPPGLQRYTATARVGTDPNEVTVDVSFDPSSGRITWLMRSRDAVTGELPEDPFAGFLPPNDPTHRGEGALSFIIRPKADLADGTQLLNKATITFDPTYGANPPIITPSVTNTVDAISPTSRVLSLPAELNGAVDVQWEGNDTAGGSGLASFDIYVSRDNGAFQIWQIAATGTSASFSGKPGSAYRFYSVARDLAGNTETAPAEPDASTRLAGGVTFATWVSGQNLPVGANGPDDDPDKDGLGNFAEYAYGTNPLLADRALAVPRGAVTLVTGESYLTLTYRRPKSEPSDVRYRVTWSPVVVPWFSGGGVVTVGTPVDRGTHLEVTVRAPLPVGAQAAGFLRLEVLK